MVFSVRWLVLAASVAAAAALKLPSLDKVPCLHESFLISNNTATYSWKVSGDSPPSDHADVTITKQCVSPGVISVEACTYGETSVKLNHDLSLTITRHPHVNTYLYYNINSTCIY